MFEGSGLIGCMCNIPRQLCFEDFSPDSVPRRAVDSCCAASDALAPPRPRPMIWFSLLEFPITDPQLRNTDWQLQAWHAAVLLGSCEVLCTVGALVLGGSL